MAVKEGIVSKEDKRQWFELLMFVICTAIAFNWVIDDNQRGRILKLEENAANLAGHTCEIFYIVTDLHGIDFPDCPIHAGACEIFDTLPAIDTGKVF